MTSSTATENFSIAQTVQADRVDIQTLYFLSFIFSHDTFDLKKSFLQNLHVFASYYLDQDRNKNNKNNSQPRNSPYTGASLVYGCSIYWCVIYNPDYDFTFAAIHQGKISFHVPPRKVKQQALLCE